MLTNEDKQWLGEHLAATEEKFSAEILAAKNDMIQVSRDMLGDTQ